MRLELVGEEAAETLRGQGSGRVIAVFRSAVYLEFAAGVIALVRTAEPGPIHAHVDELPRVMVGDRVCAEAGGKTWYAPALPAGTDMSTVADNLRHVLDHIPDLDLSGRPGPASEARLATTLRAGGLPAAVADLAGRGSGLTPAGDDILAGLFLVGRAVSGPAAEPTLVELARGAASHAISRAYLESAARGKSLAAVHDLLLAAAGGQRDRVRLARDRLARIGHTSGLDLAYGVLVGSALWADTAAVGRLACRRAS